MQENNVNPQNIMQQITAIMPQFCDRCGVKHESNDLEIVYSGNMKAMCKLNCKSCSTTYMIQVNSPSEGMVATKRSEYKSEISAKEINKFSNLMDIDANEIIDIFDALKNISNIEDFNKQFSKV